MIRYKDNYSLWFTSDECLEENEVQNVEFNVALGLTYFFLACTVSTEKQRCNLTAV